MIKLSYGKKKVERIVENVREYDARIFNIFHRNFYESAMKTIKFSC